MPLKSTVKKSEPRLRFPSGTTYLKAWDGEKQEWYGSLIIPLPNEQKKEFNAISPGIDGPLAVEVKLNEQCLEWLKKVQEENQ